MGPTTLEDLNSIEAGTSFIGTALDLGDFSLLRTPSTDPIGTIKAGGSSTNIDGTTFAQVDTGTCCGDLIFTMDDPITAFGLDVRLLNDRLPRTTVEADGTSVPIGVLPAAGPVFFGFSSDVAFTEVEFVGNIGYFWTF